MSFRLFFGRSSAPPGTLTGRSVTVSAGVLTPEITRALSGFQLTATPGTMVPEVFFAVDTFTGTNNTVLTSHTADSGQSWAVGDGSSGVSAPWIQGNRVTARNSENAHFMVLSSTSAPKDQFARAAIFINNDPATNGPSRSMHYGVGVRAKHNAGDYSGYYFGYDAQIATLFLMSFDPVTGNSTLDSAATFSPSTSTTYIFEIQARTVGGNVELKCYIDGVQKFSVTDTAPTSLLLNNDQIGILLDNAGDATSYGRIDMLWGGALAATSGDQALTGFSMTSAQGAMVPALAIPLTGFSMTASQGTLTPDLGSTVSLSGFAMTASPGTLAPEIAKALAGFGMTASGGTLTPALVVPVTGQAATAALGAMTPALAKALTGQATTAVQGSPTATLGASLLGHALTATGGAFGVSLVIPMTGAVVTAAFGTPAATSDATRALTGHALTVALGTLTPNVLVELLGVGLTVDSAAFTFPLQDAPHPSDGDIFANATVTVELAVLSPTSDLFATVDATEAPSVPTSNAIELAFVSAPRELYTVH